MQQKRNIQLGNKFILILILIFFSYSNAISAEEPKMQEKYVEIKILDKLSSKSTKLTLEIKKEKKFKNLIIKAMKCRNSEFDDNPEVTAYLQVMDTTYKENNKVFVFNGWTFSSSPSIQVFDHPVYDLWILRCY